MTRLDQCDTAIDLIDQQDKAIRDNIQTKAANNLDDPLWAIAWAILELNFTTVGCLGEVAGAISELTSVDDE